MATIHDVIDSCTASRHHDEQQAAERAQAPREPHANQRPSEVYVLPDGREVAIDATASRGAAFLGFQLAGGEFVLATRKAGQ